MAKGSFLPWHDLRSFTASLSLLDGPETCGRMFGAQLDRLATVAAAGVDVGLEVIRDWKAV